MSYKTGTIASVTLNDRDVNEIYSVQVHCGDGFTLTAYPLDSNIARIPLVGETVLLFSGIGVNRNLGGNSRLYYTSPIKLQLNPNNNSLPLSNVPTSTQPTNQSYDEASAGNPTPSNVDDDTDLGDGFEEDSNISPLQPFIGDVLIEGRFGHSLRFGYTPNTTETSQRPSWSSNNSSDPITILSNGRGSQGEYNKFIIEDVDDDKSSMWMTSTQKIRLSTSQNNLGTGVQSPAQYDNASIILNSDRLLLNAKSERIILSASETVNVATPNWAMDLDSLFTEIKNLIDKVIDLNDNVEKAHEEIASIALASSVMTHNVTAPGAPTGPPINIASFIQSQTKANVNKVQTQTIKQSIQNILQTISRMEQ